MTTHDGNGAAPEPFWSVMIPTFNPRSDYLEATLRSALQQDPGLEEMQIEVIDDGSTERDPSDTVRRVAGTRVGIERSSTNLGLAGVWNRCIERARGKWIHILHQDDLVFPGFYAALRTGIEANLEAGAAFCRHAYCDEEGRRLMSSPLERSCVGVLCDLVERMATRNCIQCASVVVKRTTYDRLGGFNDSLVHALDWEMWIRIANSVPVLYEPQVLACWRQHDNATTSRQIVSGENTRDIARAIGIWSSYLPPGTGSRLASRSRRAYALIALSLAEDLARKGEMGGFARQIESALILDSSLSIRRRALALRVKILMRCSARWLLAR